ncbi:MAG: hypothetical protein HFJ20_02210 [Clostridia bacterium]|nr:hypothetical protein [Clostridia bacterium]
MANEQNLKPVRTKSEARERGKNGGIKSGEVRKQRKTLKEELLLLLSEGQTQERISLSLIQEALEGNTKAYEIIRDTIGEKPQDNVKISGELNNPFEGLSTEELREILDG